jgi:hypothetical protein
VARGILLSCHRGVSFIIWMCSSGGRVTRQGMEVVLEVAGVFVSTCMSKADVGGGNRWLNEILCQCFALDKEVGGIC